VTTSHDRAGVRPVLIHEVALPGGPEHDVQVPPLLLAQGMGGVREIVRIFLPGHTAAFSRRDTLRPGFGRAAAVAREFGFVPVVRPQGGRLAAYHRGSVVIDHVLREPNPQAGLRDRFERYAELHAHVLAGFGLDARVGELPGEYCPGEHSINAAGVSKIAGSAQRITRDGWLFSTVIQVTGSTSIRHMLMRAYAEIGYELDPSTIGAVEDFVRGVTADALAAELRRVYAETLGATPGPLPMELLRELVSSREGAI
jgi:octanoyl-[GcvH]:protein N-octanoyltransferase